MGNVGIYGPGSAVTSASPIAVKGKKVKKEKNAAKKGASENNPAHTTIKSSIGDHHVTAQTLATRKERFKTGANNGQNSIYSRLGGADTSSSLTSSSYQYGDNSTQPIYDEKGELDVEKLKVIGTSTVLEKDYFRLTSIVDPSTVRTEGTLIKAIESIKKKWYSGDIMKMIQVKDKKKSSEQELMKEAYIYACSQLKAIRQGNYTST